MLRFCKYYLGLIPEIYKTALTWHGMTTMFILLVISGLLFLNQKLGEQIIEGYDGISWKSGFVFIGLSLIGAFLKVNFNKYNELENTSITLKSENDALKKIDLDIQYSGVPPHRDFILDGMDIFRIAVRNKSKTTNLKLVNLCLVNITSIGGWKHNVGERRLRQNGDNPPDGASFRQDAVLTPGQSLDYEFLSRWREPNAAIDLHYAVSRPGTIPSGQYRISLKATASNCRAISREFLITVDSKNRLDIEPLGPAHATE